MIYKLTLAIVLVCLHARVVCSNPPTPEACIEFKKDYWVVVPDNLAPTAKWSDDPNKSGDGYGILLDAVRIGNIRSKQDHWLSNKITSINCIKGWAYVGLDGLDQNQQNARVKLIEIWAWRDSDGDGKSTEADATVPGTNTTIWKRISSISPSSGSGESVGGDDYPKSHPNTTPSAGDVLQLNNGGTPIPIKAGESWLLLIRVVSAADNLTNLMGCRTMVENWDDGETNSVGSNNPNDKYVNHDGMSIDGTARKIDDDDIVWVYADK